MSAPTAAATSWAIADGTYGSAVASMMRPGVRSADASCLAQLAHRRLHGRAVHPQDRLTHPLVEMLCHRRRQRFRNPGARNERGGVKGDELRDRLLAGAGRLPDRCCPVPLVVGVKKTRAVSGPRPQQIRAGGRDRIRVASTPVVSHEVDRLAQPLELTDQPVTVIEASTTEAGTAPELRIRAVRAAHSRRRRAGPALGSTGPKRPWSRGCRVRTPSARRAFSFRSPATWLDSPHAATGAVSRARRGGISRAEAPGRRRPRTRSSAGRPCRPRAGCTRRSG